MKAADIPLVLIIDDQDVMLQFCERILGDEYRFIRAPDAVAAREMLASGLEVAGILLDRDFSHAVTTRLAGPAAEVRREGFYILRWLREQWGDLPVLMVTGHRDRIAAREAAEMRSDYLVWEDVIRDQLILRARLRRALREVSGTMERALHAFHACGVVGEAPSFTRALVALHRVAHDATPILLLGETGVGKDHLAAAVHRLSRGHTRPFVNVNVAALAPTLIESELFGHERYAFTDARSARPGKLRLAHGGTLLLNEIGDLAPEMQAKLLAALEQQEVVPVGGDRPLPAEFRLIAATSRNLRKLTETGRFRRDLYYRLAWNTIEIPPLRERQADIPLLVDLSLQQVAARGGKVTSLTREASEHLQTLPWDGNVRQLRAVVEAACASADYVVTLMDINDVIMSSEMSARHQAGVVESPSSLTQIPARLYHSPTAIDRETLEEQLFVDMDFVTLRHRYLKCLMRLSGDNATRVAEVSGLGRTTIFNWLRRSREAEA